MKELVNAIQELSEILDLEFRSNYSGRFMFGQKCIGVVGRITSGDFMAYLRDYLEREYEDLDICLSDYRVCQDSMGFDTIVYFPTLSM